MKPRTSLVATVLFVATVVPLSPARADPIEIQSGAMIAEFAHLPSIDVHGTDGFGLRGIPDTVTGSGPWQCNPCDPNPNLGLSLDSVQGGSDLPGVVQFQGVRYLQGLLGTGDNVAEVLLFFSGGPLELPPVNTSSVVVSGPFEVSGALSLPDVAGEPGPSIAVFGRGTATVDLVRDPSVPAWTYTKVQYVFGSNAPIPEPGTIWLVGSAIVGAVWRRRPRSAALHRNAHCVNRFSSC